MFQSIFTDMQAPSYYDILGVDKYATQDSIRAGYLAKSTNVMNQIELERLYQAFSVLSSEERRKLYDDDLVRIRSLPLRNNPFGLIGSFIQPEVVSHHLMTDLLHDSSSMSSRSEVYTTSSENGKRHFKRHICDNGVCSYDEWTE